jgi:Flp pilus assembly protein TadD
MRQNRRGWLSMLAGCVLLIGCQGPGARLTRTAPPPESTPTLTAAQKADVEFAMARSVEKSGELGKASVLYQDVLKKDPRRADALDRLAVLYARQGQFEQAVACHKKALAIQPANADFHSNLGYCYYLQNRWAEAELELQKAIELAPNHQRAHNNLGLVLAHTERSQQALAEFRRAGGTEADAHSNLAFVLTLTNSWKEAREHYARARELGPSSPAIENGLRVVTAQLKDTETQGGANRALGPPILPVPRVGDALAPRPDKAAPMLPAVFIRPQVAAPRLLPPVPVEDSQGPILVNRSK